MSDKQYFAEKIYFPDLWPRSIWKNYVQTVLKQLDRLAVWEPDTELRLGDFGRLDSHYRWEYQGNLFDDYDIKITTRTHRKKIMQIFDDNGSVKIDVVGKGKIPEIVNGGVKMEFEKKSQAAFVLINTLPESIENIQSVTKKIVELAKKGIWEPDFHVISNITNAAKMVFISSKTANSVIHVEVDAPILKKQLLVDAEVQFGVKDSSKTEYQFIANDGATPLYGLRHLRTKGWISKKHSLVKTYPFVF